MSTCRLCQPRRHALPRLSMLPLSLPLVLAVLFTPPALTSPTLCMQPILGGFPGSSSYQGNFTIMLPFPNSTEQVLLASNKGIIYSASLSSPWSDGRVSIANTFLDLSSRISASPGLGIRGMAFHPDFMDTGRFFVSFVCDTAKWPQCNSIMHTPGGPLPYCACQQDPTLCPGAGGGGCRDVLVVDEFYVPASGDLPRPDVASRQLAVGVAPSAAAVGGQILFEPGTTTLFILLGDGSPASPSPSFPQLSQNPNSPLGKVLRVDVDAFAPTLSMVQSLGLMGEYGIPDGNMGTTGVPGATYALGLRNPGGCAVDPMQPSNIVCTDFGRNQSDLVLALDPGANYGWPQCPSPPGSPSFYCKDQPLAIFGAAGGGANPQYGGGFLVSGSPDSCLNGWFLFNNGTGIFFAQLSASNASTGIQLQGPGQALDLLCSSGKQDTPCSRPGNFISWMQNSDGLPYLLADTGIYVMADPASCGVPCGSASPSPNNTGTTSPNPETQPSPSPNPSGSSPSKPTPSTSHNPSPSGNSSTSPGQQTPSGTGTSNSSPGSSPADQSNNVLSESGIQGSFDSEYWIKLLCIFAVLSACFCSPYCYFIIVGWREGRKRDQRFLQLKQAENELDERLRDSDEALVYNPPDEQMEEADHLTEDGADGDHYTEDDSLSQYSSRHGGSSSVTRSESLVYRRQDDAGSEAGSDYTSHTGYTGQSGQTGRTRQTEQTGYTGYTNNNGYGTGPPMGSVVSRSPSTRMDGGNDVQSYATRDDWTETASGYGNPYRN